MILLSLWLFVTILAYSPSSSLAKAMRPHGKALASNPLVSYVDLKIGTTGGGNSFPGSSRPFGAVKLGPDTTSSSSATAGWTSGGQVTAFSLMHESGTGGTPKYGVIGQMPISGSLSGINIGKNTTYAQTRKTETLGLVHYSTLLASGVTVNGTTSRHAGVLLYDFPATAAQANVLVDVGHHLPALSGEVQFPETYLGGEIRVDSNGTYWGNGSYGGSWNRSPKWTIFYCGVFNPPPDSIGTFSYAYDFNVPPATSPILSNSSSQVGSSSVVPGAVFSWLNANATTTKTVESRIGVSWISPDKACQFVADEVPWNTSFTEIVQDGQDEWTSDVLSTITVPANSSAASNTTLLRMLYSSLYYAGLLPSDRTGENPNTAYPTDTPYYDDFYTIWDTFRCWTPLMHLIQTQRYVGIIQSLIGTWKTDGFLPDGRSSNFNGREQGGTNADVVLADAFIKGFQHNPSINWTDGWQALWTDGNVVPPNPNPDPDSPKDSTSDGRGALPDWVKYGYITRNYTRGVSRTVEYSLNDFSLYQVAKGLNLSSEAPIYLNRSGNWQNLWNPNLTASGFSGFLSPRNAAGEWDTSAYSVTSCAVNACYWQWDTYEASPWEYSFSMPHDIASVITLSGGPAQFVARLDATFTNGYNNVGNEPSFMTPFLYNYVQGMQWKTVAEVRSIVNKYYNDGASGIPGNGDAGAMQSYLVWMLLGLYPVTGQDTYLITAPFFDAVNVRLFTSASAPGVSETPRYLSIIAQNLSSTSYYVQSVSLNGTPLNRSFLRHEEIADGGTLLFSLGTSPVSWDVGELPPSVSTGGFV